MPKKGYQQSAEHIRNGVEARRGYKHSEETKQKMRDNHHHTSWSKGLTKETDERIAHLSESMLKHFETHNAWSKGLTAATDKRLALRAETMMLYWSNIKKYDLPRYFTLCNNVRLGWKDFKENHQDKYLAFCSNRKLWWADMKKNHPDEYLLFLRQHGDAMKRYYLFVKEYDFPRYLAHCKAISRGLRNLFDDPNFIHWKTKSTIEELRKTYNIPEGATFIPASSYEHRFARALRAGDSISALPTYLTQHPRRALKHLGDSEGNPYVGYPGTTFPIEEEEYGWIDGELRKLNHKITRL